MREETGKRMPQNNPQILDGSREKMRVSFIIIGNTEREQVREAGWSFRKKYLLLQTMIFEYVMLNWKLDMWFRNQQTVLD